MTAPSASPSASPSAPRSAPGSTPCRFRAWLLATALAAGAAAAPGCTVDAGAGLEPDVAAAAHALTLGATTKLSQQGTPIGVYAHHFQPRISADGRYVAFLGRNTKLGTTYTSSGNPNVFVRDRVTGEVTAWSRAENVKAFAMSADARWFAVRVEYTAASGTHAPGLYLVDRTTGAWTTIEAGAGPVGDPAISADGSTVAFKSTTATLVPGDGNYIADIFVWSRATGAIERVSRMADGSELQLSTLMGPIHLSRDGRVVSFTYRESGDGEQRALVVDRALGTTEVVAHPNGTPVTSPYQSIFVEDMTPDARHLLISYGWSGLGVRNFVVDRVTGGWELVERNTAGAVADRVGLAVRGLSDDGRLVAWNTEAFNLSVAPDPAHHDLYVRDRLRGETFQVSRAHDGAPADDDTLLGVDLSADGRVITFASYASNLVAGDASDGIMDIFARPLTLEPVTGDVLRFNRYAGYSMSSDTYAISAPVGSGGLAITLDAGAVDVVRVAGLASYRGLDGGLAEVELDVSRGAGGVFTGWLRFDDGVAGWDSRAETTPVSVQVTRHGDREVLVHVFAPGAPGGARGLKLSIARPESLYTPAYGFAWAQSGTLADYAADPGYSRNASGLANRVTRLATGRYRVRFPGQAAALGATTHVVAYGGTSTHCKLESTAASGADLDVLVRCYRPDAAPADSPFVVAWARDTRVTSAPGLATLSWNASTVTRWTSSTGAAPTVTRSAPGRYAVRLPGQTAVGHGQVTAAGVGSARCKLESATASAAGQDLVVTCWSGASAIDAAFELSFSSGRLPHAGAGAYLFANNVSSTSYTPARAWSSLGGALRAGLTLNGSNVQYFAELGGFAPVGATVLLTAGGSGNNHCTVVGWRGGGLWGAGAPTTVDVRCWTATGASAQVPHQLSFWQP